METNPLPEALELFSNGKREEFKAFFQRHPNLLTHYSGEGDPFSYFLPALFVREFCIDLIEAGFPVFQIFEENLEDLGWTRWPQAVEHLARNRPQVLIDLVADGPLRARDLYGFGAPGRGEGGEHIDGYRIDYSLYPEALAIRLRQGIAEYQQVTDEEWGRIYQQLKTISEGPLLKGVLRPEMV